MQLNTTQWRIIQELSKKDRTPSELAEKLKFSLPSIHVQLKELERNKLISKTERKEGKTRPFTEYSLGKGFIYFIKALPGETEKKFLEINEELKLHLRIWSIPQKEYHYYVESFWWKLERYLDDIEAMAVYGSVARGEAREGSDIDILLLIKDKKKIKKYENLFGAKDVGPKGDIKMIMAQIFQTDDFENSLNKGSKFATEAIKNLIMIYDPKGKLKGIKDGFREKTI